MNYTVEINDDELMLLKSLTREECTKVQYLINKESSRAETNSTKWLEDRGMQLLLLIGKLDNVIPMAGSLTGDAVSILGKRKYSLFGRK